MEMAWFQNKKAREQDTIKTSTTRFSPRIAKEVRRFHKTIPLYQPTPLVKLKNLAGFLGVKAIWVKDESFRFNLGAFKGLGASYAFFWAMAERLNVPTDQWSFRTLMNAELHKQVSQITCVTATDGNHGRAVAWLAKQLGCKAVVYMPEESSAARFRGIQEFGAQVSIISGNYDDAVRLAEKHALEKDWLLIQDTARPGYEHIPLRVMQGYMTMFDEAFEQIRGDLPTHVFIQCGVGSFSGACQAYLAQRFREQRPVFTVVEPTNAACYYESMAREDGRPHVVGGSLETIMAGLACGEPNPIAWEILRDYADIFIACADQVAMTGMRILGNPLPGDEKVISGESGAVTLGLLYHLLRDREYLPVRDALRLDETSSILLFSTEGDTDPEIYQRILSAGKPPKIPPQKAGL